jgi:hypothetical protein
MLEGFKGDFVQPRRHDVGVKKQEMIRHARDSKNSFSILFDEPPHVEGTWNWQSRRRFRERAAWILGRGSEAEQWRSIIRDDGGFNVVTWRVPPPCNRIYNPVGTQFGPRSLRNLLPGLRADARESSCG